ncbi:MAG: hypothetical protein GXO88_10425 [Chlorobi bacterium]|nr:hypothetical protein [Chlorobiota bacterium]
MKTATIKEIKTGLDELSPLALKELCLRLSRFKKENKELLTYILFESSDEGNYVEGVKTEIDKMFAEINISSFYFIKKSVRKILKYIKTRIRYSQNKETEVELLIYFCSRLLNFKPSIKDNTALANLLERQINSINKSIKSLHKDLRYDYELIMENMMLPN